MHLSRLELDQFRLYSHMELDIPRPGLRISGRNASGKTSLLEALVMLSTTRSPRAAADREIVNWSSGSEYGVRPYVRIDAGFETRDGPGSAGIRLELDPERQSVIHKQFLLDSRPVRAHDSVGAIKCVLFSPEDVFLVSGAPSERRRQIDILISQCDRAYLTSLTQYGKVLSQRNQLLKQFARVRRSSRDIGAVTELSFWDEELVAAGSTVMAYRHMIAARIADLVRARSAVLVDDVELGFAYVPKLAIHWGSLVGEVKRDRDVVASQFQAAVEQARGEEFRRGMTVVGPHRDDFVFMISERELAAFGSRGQQRLGVVAYRLAEIDVIDQQSGERPILLLDDVLSELDSVHRNMLLTAVAECDCQLLVTSTDASLLDHPVLASLPAAEVRDGTVWRLA